MTYRVALGFAAAAATGLATMMSPANTLPAALAAAPPGPTLRLISAQRSVTAVKYDGQAVSVDPGIWVAVSGWDFRLDVRRAGLAMPETVTQILARSGATRRRRLPSAILDGWNGLKNFLRFSIRNSKGAIVDSLDITFCPDSSDAQRTSPASPAASPYPQVCGTFDPFQLATVWGIKRGWAVDPVQSSPVPDFNLNVGEYEVTETVTHRFVRLFHVPAKFATATVRVKVVKASSVSASRRVATLKHPRGSIRAHPKLGIKFLTRPPRSALPDLVAQPSWGIRTAHTASGRDLLIFGSTIWISGNSPLDIQGFRVPGSNLMKAYQYFWHNGRIIGRAAVGTMGFADYNHWHFQQFAAYRLLNASKKLVLRSHKEGFCIAPTDSVDLLLPHATWQPAETGLGGQCGVATALWVQEYLPIGWGDTYEQQVPGQAFDITNLHNGLYYIEIIANPLDEIHELTIANDISLRKVIIGGTPGNRTVCVPAYDGIDREC
jgi:hypothetical protein